MTGKTRLSIVGMLFCALLLISGQAFAQLMNGKQVKAYIGSVNMLNEQEGKIIIKIDDGSTGNWNVGKYTVVLRGSEREPLSLVLSSKSVKVWVAQDGTIQRIEILEMAGQGIAAPAANPAQGATAGMMGGKQVRDYTGSVNMLNEKDGKIIVKIDDGSTGNWNVGKYTVVLRGSEREPLSILLSSKKVKVSGCPGRNCPTRRNSSDVTFLLLLCLLQEHSKLRELICSFFLSLRHSNIRMVMLL